VTVSSLLRELRRDDIRVWAEGDTLRCTAPPGVLTPALRDRLRQEKDAIVQFLRAADALALQERAIVPMQPRGERTPVFAVPGHNGNVFSFRSLVRELGEDQPFFGLQPPGVDGECEPLTSVEELAAYFATRIVAFRPDGPCIIAGHCAGGGIALELARQLLDRGAPVTFLALFGSPYPTWFRFLPQLVEYLTPHAAWVSQHVRTLASLSNRERRLYIAAKIAERRHQHRVAREAREDAAADPVMVQRSKIEAATRRALRRYHPRRYPGRVAVFLPNRGWQRRGHSMRWLEVAGDCEMYSGPDGCEGDVMLHEPHVRLIAEQFRGYARRAETAFAPRLRPGEGEGVASDAESITSSSVTS